MSPNYPSSGRCLVNILTEDGRDISLFLQQCGNYIANRRMKIDPAQLTRRTYLYGVLIQRLISVHNFCASLGQLLSIWLTVRDQTATCFVLGGELSHELPLRFSLNMKKEVVERISERLCTRVSSLEPNVVCCSKEYGLYAGILLLASQVSMLGQLCAVTSVTLDKLYFV